MVWLKLSSASLFTLLSACVARSHAATPDPNYGIIVSPAANTTVKLDGSTLVNLTYYGIGGDVYQTKGIRVYILSFAASHPDGVNATGDSRYGLLPFMELPPNAFQPGSQQSEITANKFNAYVYPKLALPRADVTTTMSVDLGLLETYSAPGGNGMDWQNRAGAVALTVTPP